MAVSSTTLQNALRYHYLPRLRNQIHDEFVFLKIAQKAEQAELTGQQIQVHMKIGRTAGVSNPSAEAGVFPAAGNSSYLQATVPLARMLGSVEVPRELIMRAKDNAYSVVKPLTNEVDDMRRQFQSMLNWHFFRSTTGTLATVSAFSDGTPDTVTVDTTDALQPGMVIDFYDTSGSAELTNGGDISVTAITGATTFTCTMTGTPAEGDTIHLANSRGYANQGLEDIVATSGTFQGIASASYYLWQANVTTNSSSVDFSPKQYKNLLTTINRRVSRDPITIVSPEVYDAMGWVLMGSRMFTSDTWEGFWKSFKWQGHTILTDNFCPANTIYCVDKQGLLLGVLGGNLINLVDDDGSAYRLAVDSSTGRYKNSLQAHFDCYANLACTERQGHGKITNVYGLDDSGSNYSNLGGLSA